MKSEFLESELELYVQRLLVHEFYSTGNEYKMLKISPAVERLKGYDAKITGLTPFYCQFKTSSFVSQGKLFKSREAFSRSIGWPITPFHSFSLRVPNDPIDKKDPNKWQHNILHEMWKTDKPTVTYVAPRFHTKLEMDLTEGFSLYNGCAQCNPNRGISNISHKMVRVNNQFECRLPSLEGLVSIPPHKLVSSLNHSYAFTTHNDITFHSDPEKVDDGKSFVDALANFVTIAIERGTQMQSRIDLNYIRARLGEIGNDNRLLTSFIAYGLLQSGMLAERLMSDPIRTFEQEADLVTQHIALAASLRAYFGITTFGLLRVEKK